MFCYIVLTELFYHEHLFLQKDAFSLKYAADTSNYLCVTRHLKVDGCESNLHGMLKQLSYFYRFYDFFCRRHSLMNRPCYNNLFQTMQHKNF